MIAGRRQLVSTLSPTQKRDKAPSPTTKCLTRHWLDPSAAVTLRLQRWSYLSIVYLKDTLSQGPSSEKGSPLPLSVFRRLGTRGMCEMVSDGGGRFIADNIVGVNTLSLLPSPRVAHGRATGNCTQHNIPHRTLLRKKEEGVRRWYST